jgi:hypothetical protein
MRVRATLLTGNEQFEATGTVMAWQGRKVQVCVDPQFQAPMKAYGENIWQPEGTISKSIVKLWPDRIAPIGETVPICRKCRKPIGREIEGWQCDRYTVVSVECVPGDPDAYFAEMCAVREDAEQEAFDAHL